MIRNRQKIPCTDTGINQPPKQKICHQGGIWKINDTHIFFFINFLFSALFFVQNSIFWKILVIKHYICLIFFKFVPNFGLFHYDHVTTTIMFLVYKGILIIIKCIISMKAQLLITGKCSWSYNGDFNGKQAQQQNISRKAFSEITACKTGVLHTFVIARQGLSVKKNQILRHLGF